MEKQISNYLIRYKWIVTIILASLSTIVMCKLNVLKTYDFLTWMLFFILNIFFYKIDIFNSKYYKNSLFFSILFSFLFILGRLVFLNYQKINVDILSLFLSLKSLFYIIGVSSFLFPIFMLVIPFLCSYEMELQIDKKHRKIYIFLGSSIIIFLAYMPYFLSMYPGTISPDSYTNIDFAFGNLKNLSDHHTILYQLITFIPLKLGMFVFNDINAAVACSSLFQMLLMSIIFASSLVFLDNRNVPYKVLIIVLLYYAFAPVHGYYSVTMWKDILFSCSIVLLIMQLIKVIENKNVFNKKVMISFFFVSLLVIFLRNNAIYMYIILMMFTVLLFKDMWKKILIFILSIFMVFVFIKGPIFDMFNVQKSSSAEYIGMPLQQIGRMVSKDVQLTTHQEKLINELIPLETLKETYNPKLSDGIKFNKKFNIDVFNKNKLEYAKLWMELVLTYPHIAVESYLVSTIGYWYPDFEYWTVYHRVVKNKDYDIHQKSLIGENNIFTKLDNKKLPIVNMQWSIAFGFWILLIFAYVSKKRKGWIGVYPFIPIFGIWLTMMLASPVFGEFRYIYALYTSLPILIVFTFLPKTNV